MKIIEVKTQEELLKALQDNSEKEIRLVGSGVFEIRDSSQVTAYGSSQVRAYGSSQVRAYGSSQVTAYGSSQVTACDSSQVRACDSSQVTACDSSQVTAYDSSQVTAYGSSQVRAYGSSQVRATKYVAVTQQSKKSKIKGGVLIKLPGIKTAIQWCNFYGVTVKAGVAILFKALRNDYKSSYGFLYSPNTAPSAPDWDGGEKECGGGLHFSPRPFMALNFDKEATRFMACPVLVKEIKVHKNATYPEKVKAPRVFKPCYEVDIDGKRI